MAWHQWAFYTSLAVWVIVIPFEAPDPSRERGYPTTTWWPYSWCCFPVTLICAGIMYLGFRGLQLYLEKISDALATARTTRNSRGIYESRSEETVMVPRTLVECHNRLASFLSKYSGEIEEIEGEIRTNVRSVIEDIGSWKTDLGSILWQSRRGSSLESPGSTATVPKEVPTQPREPNRPSAQPQQPAAPQRPVAPITFDQKVPPVLGKAHKLVQPPKPLLTSDTKEQQRKALKMKFSRLDSYLERLGLHSPPITKGFRRHSYEQELPSTARQTIFGMKKDKATIMEPKQTRKPPLLVAIHPARDASGIQEQKEDVKSSQELSPLPTDDTTTGSETTAGSEMSENPPEAARTASSGTALIGSEVKQMLKKGVPEEAERELEPNVGPPVELTSEPEMLPKEELAECKGKATTALSQEPPTSHHLQPVGSFLPEPRGSFDSEAQEADADLTHLVGGSETAQEHVYVADVADVKNETSRGAATEDASEPKALASDAGLIAVDTNDGSKKGHS